MDKRTSDFIERHKLHAHDFFDAEGGEYKDAKEKARELNKLFIYNTKPREGCGHSIWDRNSHCLECNPKQIAFIMRDGKPGYVYIACSKSTRMTKIGLTTEDVSARESKLNSKGYAGTHDWKIVSYILTSKANKVEARAQAFLRQVRKGDKTTGSREAFFCSFLYAEWVIQFALRFLDIKPIKEKLLVSDPKSFQMGYEDKTD